MHHAFDDVASEQALASPLAVGQQVDCPHLLGVDVVYVERSQLVVRNEPCEITNFLELDKAKSSFLWLGAHDEVSLTNEPVLLGRSSFEHLLYLEAPHVRLCVVLVDDLDAQDVLLHVNLLDL